MLKMEGAWIRAGDFELSDLHLEVPRGEFHVLLGPTGTGKTLILETLAGLHPLRSGVITLGGRDLTGLPPEARGMAYVPQDLALFPHLNVEENVRYGLRIRRMQRPEAERFLNRLIEVTGIRRLLTRPVAGLSGGERQRVALVRALAVQPRVLLMDEPLSALHPSLRWELRDLLKQVHAELGLTLLMVTHDLDDALTLGQGVTILTGGRLYPCGRLQEALRAPPSLAVARFLGLRNLFPGRFLGRVQGELRIDVPDLGTLRVQSDVPVDPPSHAAVTWGIPERDVTIIKPDRAALPRTNVLQGALLSCHDRGREVLAVFRPDRGDIRIRILVPDYIADRLALKPGKNLSVELKADRIFLLPERSP